MKKVVLSLLMAIACMPMAIGQTKAGKLIVTDTTACGKFTWNVNNVTYTESTASPVTVTRGDTAFILNLTMLPYAVNTEVIPVTGVCSASWNNKTWKEPGTFNDTLTAASALGCDSIVTINVTLGGSENFNQTITACDTYKAPWGTEYTVSTDIEGDTIHAANCDYVATLHLTINAGIATATEQVEAGCSYAWHGQTIVDSEIHYDTLTTTKGCDSIVSVHVTNFTGIERDTTELVSCDFYVNGDDTLTASTILSDTVTEGSCQKINVTRLIIVPSYTDSSAVVVRDTIGGCRLNWLNHNYTINDTNEVIWGVAKTTVGRCDSLAAIRITAFTGIQRDTTYVTSCGRYRWSLNSSTYYYTDTIDVKTSTSNGCTTERYLNLTLRDNYDTARVTACETYTYTFSSRNGQTGVFENATFTTSGTHSVDANGDSLYSYSSNTRCKTYHTILLTVNEVSVSEEAAVDTVVCDRYTLSFFNTHNFTSSVDTVLVYPNHEEGNCEDIRKHVKVTVNYKSYQDEEISTCDSYYWPVTGNTYTASTVETKTLDSVYNADGCDIVARLNLTINKTPVVVIEGDWNLDPDSNNVANLTASDDANDHNTYKWFKNTETTPFSTAKSVSVNVNANTDIHLEATSQKGCKADQYITITYQVGIDDVDGISANVYPNPASRYINIECAEGIADVVIYNALGQQVVSRSSINASATQLDLGTLAVGNYTMQIRALDGKQTTRKFIVNK